MGQPRTERKLAASEGDREFLFNAESKRVFLRAHGRVANLP